MKPLARRLPDRRPSMLALALLGLLLGGTSASAQTVWFVDASNPACPGTGTRANPFCAIQRAIAAASSGDTVLVLPGQYLENLDFLGKDLHVRSDEDGDPSTPRQRPDATIVDGQGLGSVVRFTSGEGPLARLSGFTLTHGTGTLLGGGESLGGGVLILNSAGHLDGNLIIGNQADSGGGIYADNAGLADSEVDQFKVLIQGNRIVNNRAVDPEDSDGAGICLVSCTADILDNDITGNVGTTGGGGGLYVHGFEDPYDYFLANNLVVGNRNAVGGGLHLDQGEVSVLHTTFVGNEATSTDGGNAVRLGSGGSYAHVLNSILWANGSGPEVVVRSNSGFDVEWSDLQGGQGGVLLSGTGASLGWGPGMIDLAPQFVDADGLDNRHDTQADNDLHLTATSPCFDAGFAVPSTVPRDLEGNPRGPGFDMGADEFHPHAYAVGNATPGGTIVLRLIEQPGTPLWQLWLSVAALEFPHSTSLGDWYLLPPWIRFNLSGNTVPASGVLSLTGVLPAPTPLPPYDLYLQFISGTLPDAGLSGLVPVYVR